jgi:heptosyltransferase II
MGRARALRQARTLAQHSAADGGRILVVGPAWVGDMVMAQSLFAVLKRRRPGAALHVLAPPATLPLLSFMPEVERAIALPPGHGRLDLAARWRLGRSLRRERYDWAIVLPRSFKSALVPFWAGARRRTGYRGELRYGLLTDIREDPGHAGACTVDRFVTLAFNNDEEPTLAPHPSLIVATEAASAALAAVGTERPRLPLLALCPGAEYGPSKRWPTEHYAVLARRYVERGWTVWLMGGPADQQSASAIAAAAGSGCVDLAGRTSLSQAVALLSLADAVVSNDSGLMHVAAGLRRPQVALFGSSSPEITPPSSDKAVALWLRVDCSPCFKRDCPLGHHRCLRELSPTMVEEVLERVTATANDTPSS